MSDQDDMRNSPLPEWAQRRYVQGLRTFAKEELIFLWAQLADCYRLYLNTTWIGQPTLRWDEGNEQWSGGCEAVGNRIKAATELVGPVSWRNVGMSQLADGWYVWANRKLGITNPSLPDAEGMAYVLKYMEEQQRMAR